MCRLVRRFEAQLMDTKTAQNDSARWRQRAQQLMDMYEKVDPTEYCALLEEKSTWDSTKALLESEMTQLQELVRRKARALVSPAAASPAEPVLGVRSWQSHGRKKPSWLPPWRLGRRRRRPPGRASPKSRRLRSSTRHKFSSWSPRWAHGRAACTQSRRLIGLRGVRPFRRRYPPRWRRSWSKPGRGRKS